MGLLALATVVILAGVALSNSDAISAKVVLAAMAMIFVGVVARLVGTMLSADPKHGRKAREYLLFCAIAPALILAPAELDAAGRENAAVILLVTAVWLALTIAPTSYLLASATRQRQIQLVRTHFHRPVPVVAHRANNHRRRSYP